MPTASLSAAGCPRLDVPAKAIHDPWAWADKQGVTLDYPRPIVDHKQARVATLAAYEAARKA
jgi:deoxyribodipyrimidine photo-lyase